MNLKDWHEWSRKHKWSCEKFTASDWGRLRRIVRTSLFYHAHRTLENRPAAESLQHDATASRRGHRAAMRKWYAPRYRILRAAGMSGYEADAAMQGTDAKKHRQQVIERKRQWRADLKKGVIEPRGIVWLGGERLESLRKREGLSKQALADAARLNWETIFRLERGLQAPKQRTIERLAEVLHVPAKALEAGATNKKRRVAS